jgi:hypothetical protein
MARHPKQMLADANIENINTTLLQVSRSLLNLYLETLNAVGR